MANTTTWVITRIDTMKVTKKQLRRIIKEEKAKILAENRIRQIIREAMTSATRPPTNPREWMAGGDG